MYIYMDGKGFFNVCVINMYYRVVYRVVIFCWVGEELNYIDVLLIVFYVIVIVFILKIC